MIKKIIKFDKTARNDVLSFFDKEVDVHGYIVEKDTLNRVLTPEGEEIKMRELGAVTKGSEAFIKSDLLSLFSLSDKIDS